MSTVDIEPGLDAHELDQPGQHAEPGSLQERFQQRRQALEANRTVEIEVAPAWAGMLAARYHKLGFKELQAIVERAQKETRDSGDQVLYSAADTLIRACDDLLVIHEDGSRESLGIKWGLNAARTLIPSTTSAETARQAVFEFFPNDMDLVAHSNEVSEWMQGKALPGEDVEERLLGESAASSAGV